MPHQPAVPLHLFGNSIITQLDFADASAPLVVLFPQDQALQQNVLKEEACAQELPTMIDPTAELSDHVTDGLVEFGTVATNCLVTPL
jgi:hypothetical protein